MEENAIQRMPEQVGLQMFSSAENFELAQRMARVFTQSTIVPTTYQGDKNIGNVMIALDMAMRMNANPLFVMQNLFVIHGNPGWSSKFLVATLNTCGRFKTPLRYEFRGQENTDEWACRAYAVDKSGETRYGAWVSIGTAKKEGWMSKNGSKWLTMPQLMLMYRSAAFFQRVYAPEVSMGLSTMEELEDTTKGTPIDIPSNEVVELDPENIPMAEAQAAPPPAPEPQTTAKDEPDF